MAEKFYITTAIAYTSKKPHLGNIYEAILTDAIARFRRMQGYDVHFLTGTDEHGEKIQTEAEKAGVTPQAYVDRVAGEIRGIWDSFRISYDQFIRTTDEQHVKVVQKIFKKFYEQGDIYKGAYEGNYCTPCESFWTDSQLVNGCCPTCGAPVTRKKEEAYFFKMSKYADRLLAYMQEHGEFITPDSRRNEMINNFLKPGLQDLCVSRTSFSWGIPVTFDEKHVVYVWLDALNNYITAAGYDPDGPSETYKKLWPADLHVIGKDICRFHTIYWPIFLMALGEPLPKKVLSHPWLLFGTDKMSKSKGNVIYGDELIGDIGLDAARHYLLAEVGYFNDGSITYEAVVKRTNTDLANTLGNLISRTCAMIKQYRGGVVPANGGKDDEFARGLKRAVCDGLEKAYKLMDIYFVADAVESVFGSLRACNKYIDETMPWALAKDPEKQSQLDDVLSNLIESIRLCAVMLFPFMPDASERILNLIGAGAELAGKGPRPAGIEENGQSYGPVLTSGYVSFSYTYPCTGFDFAKSCPDGQIPILFSRIDEKKYLAEVANRLSERSKVQKAEAQKASEPVPGLISIDDFAKVALTVAQIKTCEKVEKSDKLYKLTVDCGTGTKQIVSGIAKWYAPEDLIGKKLILVNNLKPAVLRGVESQGMILAADCGNEVKVLFVDDAIPTGSKVR